ncbi:PREDICTED: TMV resistance protein N-like [Populus euphratica]|uniref:ADP-ribosyl cyclase/cyclic ADP-ribose hydrolase n=1 Tax=Populus euphratica TaxID=75702 RepID=A0AAJ6UXW7_POPEU|nr:PREDICTED: TMV resistance protein N-like [Populus euphratica]
MASTSPTTPYLKHDVFLSFRGTDTRNSFTSHLYHALQRNQIDAYIDDKLDGGEKIEPAILERIEESYISVVIFSENYAYSTFCLRELSKILECMETKQQMVLPVFHQLDPCQVQNLSGSYGDALCKHEKDCGSKEVESWRNALKEIANLKGWNSNVIKDEAKLIEEIVSDIQNKLLHAPSPPINSESPVGMKSRLKDIDSLLSLGSTGVLIVGIWGMGGIGKSTTAEAVYHRNCSKFEGHCFFQNVREESQKHGIDHVRQEILGEVLEKKDMTIRTKVLPLAIKRMLQRKKVLIVLDDVNDPQVLKYLLGEDGLFGQGSRIIVTSRDRQVLINACDEDKIYEVKILDKDDALRLFSLHAFKQNNPIEGSIGLSKTVVSCVKGIPLVLEVLGASLYRKTSVEYWESKVAQLRKNGGEDIKKCLEMCYHELDQTEKKIFLDIACFFGRCKRDLLQQTLDLEERSGIDRLIDMCLIKIVQNKISMHDVLVKLGKKIVHQENVDPRERSRLWEADDIYRVLTTQGTGSKVESISLILDTTKDLSPTAFEGMYNLRLLKIYYPPDPSKEQIMNGKRVGIHLPGGLHCLSSELRFLYWYNYPLKSMPSNFSPKKAFQLEMPCSQLEQLWNEYQPLENLKLMKPPSSKLSLIDSDLSKVPHLEALHPGIPSSIKYSTRFTTLELPRLESFCTLPSSIGCLSQLVRLNLPLCESLASLPDNIDELKSLVELDLYSCSKLESLPNSICKLKCLTKLNLGCQPKLASLPDNIGELRSLVKLSLSSCSKLASLPDSIGELRSLVELHLSSCSGLASLPDSIGGLKSLEWFDLNGCFGLASLPDSIGGLKSLQWFDLNGCFGLASLPDTIGALKSLQSLSLRGCSGLASLPDIISGLKSLMWLNLSGCSGLKSLPDSIGELKHLTTLLLSGCLKLASLPDNFIDLEFRGLDKQRCYMLRGFQKVEEIASSTYKLGCHEFLNLGNSRVLKTPESLGSLVSLTNLRLSQIDFERIPASIKHLTKLRELFLDECKRLQCLPELPSTLQVLIASGCISLKSVAGIFMQGDREYEAASQEFNFSECLQLDQNSRTRIMGDARLQIQRTATSLFDQQYHCKPIRVRLCIPGLEVPECFSYKNREGSSVKIGQPAHCYRGFTFCAVVSFGQSGERRPVNIECECHLIIKDGTQIDLSSYYYGKYEGMASSTVWKREHVFIWSVHSKCFFKEASFHFKPLCGATDVVVQCGVHPLLK